MEAANIETGLARLRDRIERHGDALGSEEAIKAVLVSPFLTALGHDPSDPDQVLVGVKNDRGRADYVVVDDGGTPLVNVAIVSDPADVDTARARAAARLAGADRMAALLTDGRRFRFHTLVDGAFGDAFLSFAATDAIEAAVLMPLARPGYDLDAAIAAARTTRPGEVAWEALLEQLDVDGELRTALARLVERSGVAPERAVVGAADALARLGRIVRGEEAARAEAAGGEQDDEEGDRRPMTGDEQAAFDIVRDIAAQYIDASRIHARPAQSYLAILADDNNRRTICRLYFTAQSTRHISTFVGRAETRHRIGGYAEVAEFAGAIADRLRELDPGAFERRAAEAADAASAASRIELAAEPRPEAADPTGEAAAPAAPSPAPVAPAGDDAMQGAEPVMADDRAEPPTLVLGDIVVAAPPGAPEEEPQGLVAPADEPRLRDDAAAQAEPTDRIGEGGGQDPWNDPR